MRYTGIGDKADELALQFCLVRVVNHHDERAANALQRLLNDSGIIEVTLHDFRRIGIESHLVGISDQGSEGYIRSRQRFGGCGTDAPGGAR